MNVLIIGNILKDVYLKLDETKNNFEIDENGTPWLDLAFNGSTHNFFRRSSIYGGATVSLEVLNKFGHDAKVVGSRLQCENGEVSPNGQMPAGYRYILCHENKIAYFSPNEHEKTVWENPTEPIDWLFIDRSAGVTKDLLDNINSFLSMSSSTRVAMYARENMNEFDRELASRADLIFSEGEYHDTKGAESSVCEIFKDRIKLGEVEETWQSERLELMTRLTLYSIISASIFGALLNGRSVREAVKFAKLNAEGSSLKGTLTMKKLEEMLSDNHDNMLADTDMIAAQMVAPKKGILAADESGGSIQKKFAQLDIPDDEQHRRDYRNIFLSTEDLEKYVNGVILFDETTRQKADNGQDFVSFLTTKGIIPGIKVDQGLEDLEGAVAGEKYTKGLEGLPERLNAYYDQGLRFAKWRAAFEITSKTPSDLAIDKNCEILAQYAKYCQAAGIVPIVEPEVVHDGNYTIEKCAEVTGKILKRLFEELDRAGVRLEACILKCNMVLAGKKYPISSTPEEVGRATAEILKANVPEALAGVVFLSGGQTVEQATDNLRAVEKNGPFPWPVTFSFARALQDPALYAWKGNNANCAAASEAFKKRLIANTEALEG
ncbi:fructose-bisphosphate aldolase class I [Candidatus Saccharibacteria bacterium]|nr:fructose-bisphosphate aldolase class I [Candidatus Saccharibacteria bacterium]